MCVLLVFRGARTLKNELGILTATISIAVVAGFGEARAETLEDFAGRIKSTLAKPDANSTAKLLINLDGMDEELIAMYEKRTIPILTRKPVEDVTFEPLPADFRLEYVLQGYEYRPNLKPLGLVVINGKTRAPYGKIGESYFITGMTRTLVNANPPVEHTLQVNVFGFSTPPIRYSGSCNILQSNDKSMTMQIEDTGVGNNTMALNAVRFEACEVTKLSGEGPLTMRVVEGGEVVFEGQSAEIGSPLRYRFQSNGDN